MEMENLLWWPLTGEAKRKTGHGKEDCSDVT